VLQAISERRIPLHTSGFEVEPIHDGAGNTLTHSEVAARRLTSMRSAQVSLQRELIRALESTSAGQRAVAAGAGVRRQVEPPAGHVPLDSFSVDGEDSHPLLEHRRTINAACSSSSWSETAGCAACMLYPSRLLLFTGVCSVISHHQPPCPPSLPLVQAPLASCTL
jgi:hypothetical protein